MRTPIIIKSGSIEFLADTALIELTGPVHEPGRYYSYALATGPEAAIDVFTASRGGPLTAAIDREAGPRTVTIWSDPNFEGRPDVILSVAPSGYAEKLVIQVLGERLVAEEPLPRKHVYRLDRERRVGSLLVADTAGRELVRRAAIDHAVVLVQTDHARGGLPDDWMKGAVLGAGAVALVLALGSLFRRR